MQLDSLPRFSVLHPPLPLLQSWLTSRSLGHRLQSGQPKVVYSTLQRMLGLLQRLSLRLVSITLLTGMLG